MLVAWRRHGKVHTLTNAELYHRSGGGGGTHERQKSIKCKQTKKKQNLSPFVYKQEMLKPKTVDIY
jgi:hypothetical protein